MNPIAKRQLMRQLKGSDTRVSFYRMVRSPAFDELCDFYEHEIGMKRFDQFAAYAAMLEKTFTP